MTLQQLTLSVEIPAWSGTDAPLPDEFCLISGPLFETTKGTFLFDQKAADSVMAAYNRGGIPLSGDYEHQSHNPLLSGPIPASFWGGLEVRPGEVPGAVSLWATGVKWTPRAADALRNREYRFYSPTVKYDKDKRVVELLNVALTNLPATMHQAPLVAASRREGPMTMSDTATPTDQVLLLCGAATHSDALPILAAWKASHDALPAVQSELAQLRSSVTEGEKRAIVASMRAAGKALPTQETFLLSLSTEQLRAYESTAPVLLNRTAAQAPASTPLGEVVDGKPVTEWLKASAYDLTLLERRDPDGFQRVRAAKKAATATT